MSTTVHVHGPSDAIHPETHDAHAHHESFLTRYFFSRDHKRIGIQFLLASLFFFVIGGLLAMAIRWHLAYPKADFPMRWMMPRAFLGEAPADPTQWKVGWPVKLTQAVTEEGVAYEKDADGAVQRMIVDTSNKTRPVAKKALVLFKGHDDPVEVDVVNLVSVKNHHFVKDDAYSTLFTMHGSVMIFLVIIPLMVGAFANFVVPLQIGARDMAFPTLNMISFWLMPPAALILMYGMTLVGSQGEQGGPGAGWTSYPPLAVLDTVKSKAQVCWLLGVLILGFSSIFGSINYITTIVKLRSPGMTFFRMPLTTWSVFITSILVAFATPVLAAALLMQIMDHTFHTSFFETHNIVYGQKPTPHTGGGQALLWQHLFWFYSHPAVYIMILPAMGIASDVLSVFARKPLFGYRPMIYAIAAIAGLGFIVWGHHMFVSGMNPALGTTFTLSTIMIALPSAIKTFNWLGTLWRGNIQFTTPMLNALAFVSMFVIGGLSGIFMASTPVDMFIHDTYFIVAHLHYVLFGGSIFGAFAGIYFWFPKMFGRMMNETWGRIHFFLTLVTYNCTFFAMHILGMGGMPRRYAGFMKYQYLDHLQPVNVFISISAFLLGAVQIIFAINFFYSMFKGKVASQNPWQANTLEWQTGDPKPGHGNFERSPVVYRGPYEYSSPLVEEDYLPQTRKLAPGPQPENLGPVLA